MKPRAMRSQNERIRGQRIFTSNFNGFRQVCCKNTDNNCSERFINQLGQHSTCQGLKLCHGFQSENQHAYTLSHCNTYVNRLLRDKCMSVTIPQPLYHNLCDTRPAHLNIITLPINAEHKNNQGSVLTMIIGSM